MNHGTTIAPIGRQLTEAHRVVIIEVLLEQWIWSKARERLAVASLQVATEITDPVVAGRAVEAVSDARVVEVDDVDRAGPRQRVRSAPDAPYTAGRGVDCGERNLDHPPDKNAFAAIITSLIRPSATAVAGEESLSCGLSPTNHARIVCLDSAAISRLKT